MPLALARVHQHQLAGQAGCFKEERDLRRAAVLAFLAKFKNAR
jgi:hypothetical protein